MRSKYCQAAILRGQHVVHAAQGLDDLAQETSPISRLDARCAAARRELRRRAGVAAQAPRCARIAPQDAVGAGFEARHVAGKELRADRDRSIVDFELHAARRSRRYTRMGAMPAMVLHAVGTAIARERPSARGVVHIDPGVRGKAQAKPRPARPCSRIGIRDAPARAGVRAPVGPARPSGARRSASVGVGPGSAAIAGRATLRRAMSPRSVRSAARSGFASPPSVCSTRRRRPALVPGLPPENAEDQQRGGDRTYRCAATRRLLTADVSVRSRTLDRLRGWRLGACVTGLVARHDFRGRQSQARRVSLQMPFGVHRRADALVIVGFERIDRPSRRDAVHRQPSGRSSRGVRARP